MKKFCLIISLSAPWYNHPRKHFFGAIADTIYKHGGFILCLEPTILSLHTLILYPKRIKNWLRGKYKFRKEDKNIYVVPAHTLEHILLSVRFKPLIWLNKIILKRQLRKALNKMDKQIGDVIWMFHRPELYYLIGIINKRGIIYDCCDDYNLTVNMNPLKVLGNERREKILAEKSNFVIASADLLYERNLKYNKNTFLVENGFSKAVFQTNHNSKIDSLENMKRPVIGYIGNIKHWLDYELLDFLLSSRRHWNFVFAGEVIEIAKKKFGKLLRKHKNIYSTGWIHYSSFPHYLRYFDVGIIPFNTNAFMDSANPNKLYDYLAAGVPVVATNIGDLRKKCSEFVRVSDSKEEFLRNIESVLIMTQEEKLNLRQRIRDYSKGHSWEDNAVYLFDLMKKYILK